MLDEWVVNDVGQYSVQIFDATLANTVGEQPGSCIYAKKRGHASVMEFNGECPKNRILTTSTGEPGLNWLCEGFKMYYRHTQPYMEFMANELFFKRPPANVMAWARRRRKTP